MDKHRAAELFEIVRADHHAQQAQGVLVRNFDHVGLFFKQDLSDDRILDHVLPRHHDPVSLVEKRGIICRNVVDLREFVYLFDGFRLAGDDQTYLALMSLGGGEKIIERRTDPTRILVVVVSYMYGFDRTR